MRLLTAFISRLSFLLQKTLEGIGAGVAVTGDALVVLTPAPLDFLAALPVASRAHSE